MVNLRPTADAFDGFRGQVVRPTPGIAAGSQVEIERERDGWHLFVTSGAEERRSPDRWDIWCDDWVDVEHWFREWAINWQTTDR